MLGRKAKEKSRTMLFPTTLLPWGSFGVEMLPFQSQQKINAPFIP